MSEPPANPPRLTKNQIQLEELRRRDSRYRLIIDRVHSVVVRGTWAAVTVAIAFFGYRSVDAMAGKSTDFKSVIDWAAKIGVNTWVPTLAAVLFGSAFLRERSLRRKKEKSHE